ncbi:dioxygenase family protein [Candidatus Jidaibacter acanthamoebae]|nr:hypothetical protein [Candidatus Jidaibacter acanthamoeba]
MLKVNYCIFAAAFLIQLNIAKEAYSNFDAQFNTQCPLTPSIWDDTPFEGKIIKNNNLRKKVGSPDFAEGEFINITGKILDSNCVPVAEAVVEIWQADASGNIVLASNKIDKNFAYTGTAITNNLGQYNFFTIFPGVVDKQAPRIHFKVKHPDFLPFESYMYFPNNNLNEFDSSLRNILDKKEKNLLISAYTETINVPVTYNFNLTLEGVNKYKRY